MNQNPEQLSIDKIDADLIRCGCLIQNKSKINLNLNLVLAVGRNLVAIGISAYVFFVNRRSVGIIEAKGRDECIDVTIPENKSEISAKAKRIYF